MWVKVTCRNGHRVKIDSKFVGRSNKCPKCQSGVYLWIRVQCPNGHGLKVKSKYCGKTGTCPQCKAEVEVPDLTEALALEALEGEGGGPMPVHQEADLSGSSVNKKAVITRICPMCEGEIAKSYRTCPICNKYIGTAENADPLATPKRSTQCAQCGSTSFPGDTYCSNCGMPLPHQEQAG